MSDEADYYLPSKHAKTRTFARAVIDALILIGAFFYSKQLAFASVELIESDMLQGQYGIFKAFGIFAVAVALVMYLLLWRNLSLGVKTFKQGKWPPANANLGSKTRRRQGRSARWYALRLMIFSVPLILAPIPWQYQAYNQYQQVQATKVFEERMQAIEDKLEACY